MAGNIGEKLEGIKKSVLHRMNLERDGIPGVVMESLFRKIGVWERKGAYAWTILNLTQTV